MKTLMVALCFVFGLFTAASAQDTTQHQQPNEQELQIVNEKIEPRELPESIKDALVSQEYRGWLVNAAYKSPKVNPDTTDAHGDVMYLVELVSGTQTKTVEFDKNGNPILDPEEDRE